MNPGSTDGFLFLGILACERQRTGGEDVQEDRFAIPGILGRRVVSQSPKNG